MSRAALAIGDLVRCSCGAFHPAEQHGANSDHPYADDMLYVRCKDGLRYVGQRGLACRHEVKNEET